MEPNIHDGAFVLVQIRGFNASALSVGTVIVYRYNATLNVDHRIIGIFVDPVRYLVKGDNNTTPDPYEVWPKDILAVLVLIIWH
jgi:signal peptidase I